jgi:uncharacterized protein YndB with AHSA1/START domain
MNVPATGRIEPGPRSRQIVIERSFRAPIEDVWDSIVDPERMNRWIGTWSGEGGAGNRITFTMTAEGQTEGEDAYIHACDPPRYFDVESSVGNESWRMTVTLTEVEDGTRLVFTQDIDDTSDMSSYAIGWEYYLDRLVAVHTDQPFANWDDYYPSQQEFWQAANAASLAG